MSTPDGYAWDYTPLLVPGQMLTVRTAGRITAGDPVEVAGPGQVQRAAGGSLAYLGIAAASCPTDSETAVMIGGTIQESRADGDIQAGDLLVVSAVPGRVRAVRGPGVPPAVDSITPVSGPATGGDAVRIGGARLDASAAPPVVRFGGAAATNVVVVSATEITCDTPPHAAGTVDVTVTTDGGTGTLAGGFTYVAPPAPPDVTGVAPVSGPAGGGTGLTITGSGFTGATGVTVGGTAATGVAVVDDSTLTCTTGAHAAGLVAVIVTGPGGPGNLPAAFTYIAAPAVTGVAPPSGPVAGGTTVTLTGTGFTGATQATFGGTQATGLVVDSATSIRCTTPPGTAGAVPVAVSGPGGASAPLAGGFTYIAAPTVTLANPDTAPLTGTSVTLTGTNLSNTSAVSFGGNAGSAIVVNSPTSVTCTAPAHTAGAAPITVTTPGGTSAPYNGFTYAVPPPAVSSLNPDSGTALGGNQVTITGTGLTGATGVTIGGAPATSVAVQSPTAIICNTPPGTAGPASVVVTTPAGTSGATGNGAYTYQAPLPPAITGCNPPDGPEAGGNTIIVQGTDMTGATSVTFDGIPATGLTAGPAAVLCTNPPHAAGVIDVVVTAPGGNSGATGDGAFTYTITAAASDDEEPAARSGEQPGPKSRKKK